jgi:hypothetical protein
VRLELQVQLNNLQRNNMTPYDFLNNTSTTANSTQIFPDLAPISSGTTYPQSTNTPAPVVAPKPVAPTINNAYQAPAPAATPAGTSSAVAAFNAGVGQTVPTTAVNTPAPAATPAVGTITPGVTTQPYTGLGGMTGNIKDIYGDASFYNDRNAWLASQGITEDAEKANLVDEMQRQINASNALYAEKLRQAKVAGDARLGGTMARNQSRGAVGGSFGSAAVETEQFANQDIYNTIEQEKAAAEGAIRAGIKNLAKSYYEDKRAAAEAGYKDRIAFKKNEGEYGDSQANAAVEYLIANNSTPDSITDKDAKDAGTTLEKIKKAFLLKKYESTQAEKKRKQELEDKIAAQGPISVGEGNRIIDRVTGKEIFYNPKTYAPKEGSGVLSTSGMSGVSPAAQNYIKLIDSGEMTLDEALIRVGSSKAGLALKNEIVSGMANSGGRSAKAVEKVRDTKRLVDEVLNGDTEYFGASIAPRFRAVNPYYASFQTKLDSLVAALTSENTGTLKGPMSDKDIQFLKDMSSGLDIAMDEKTAKKRLTQIRTRLNEKLAPFDGGGSNGGGGEAITAPDGTQVIITD